MKIIVTGSKGFIGSKLKKRLEELGHQVFDHAYTKVEGIDLVYHLAAKTDVQASFKDPIDDARANILLTLEVLKNYPDVRIIYPASACEIEEKSPYGISKRAAAKYVEALAKDYVILLLSNVWGEGGHGVINIFQNSEICTIYGTGEQTRTITHVDDIVEAFIHAMNVPKGKYSVGGEVVTVNEIVRRIGKPFVHKEAKEGEIYASVIPNTLPGFEPKIKL